MLRGIFGSDSFIAGLAEPSRGQKSGDVAYQRLRHLIVSLELEPGSQVDELSLSKMLGLGRTPIREALLRLSQDNLVHVIPRKGTMIAPINIAELREVEELRWGLESTSARWAAERASEQELHNLETLISKAKAGDFSSIDHWHVEVDRRFHLLLARAAANRYLVSTLDRLYNHSVRLFYASRATMAAASEEMHDYERVLDAVRKRKPAMAEERMRDHLMDSRKRMAEAFGSSFDISAVERAGER